MTIQEQSNIAKKTNNVLVRFGLKKNFVAKKCGISETTFYQFLNNKTALSDRQLSRVASYVEDYVRRNS